MADEWDREDGLFGGTLPADGGVMEDEAAAQRNRAFERAMGPDPYGAAIRIPPPEAEEGEEPDEAESLFAGLREYVQANAPVVFPELQERGEEAPKAEPGEEERPPDEVYGSKVDRAVHRNVLQGVAGALEGVGTLTGLASEEAEAFFQDVANGVAPRRENDLVAAFVREGASWGVGYGIASKMLRMASIARKHYIITSFVAGAAADWTMLDPYDPRFATLAKQAPGLGTFIPQWMATHDPNDPAWEQRLKNVLEGAMLGAVAEGVIRGIGAVGATAAADALMDQVRKADAQLFQTVWRGLRAGWAENQRRLRAVRPRKHRRRTTRRRGRAGSSGVPIAKRPGWSASGPRTRPRPNGGPPSRSRRRIRTRRLPRRRRRWGRRREKRVRSRSRTRSWRGSEAMTSRRWISWTSSACRIPAIAE